MYDLIFPDAHGLFASLGAHSLRMLAAAAGFFIHLDGRFPAALSSHAGIGRYWARHRLQPKIESPGPIAPRARHPSVSRKTLARSRKRQVFLITYLGVGSLSPSISQRQSTPARSFSRKMERAFPFLSVLCDLRFPGPFFNSRPNSLPTDSSALPKCDGRKSRVVSLVSGCC